jgi:hypothetical protein
MNKFLRNTRSNVVTQYRKLLQEAVAEVLEGQFGIYAINARTTAPSGMLPTNVSVLFFFKLVLPCRL